MTKNIDTVVGDYQSSKADAVSMQRQVTKMVKRWRKFDPVPFDMYDVLIESYPTRYVCVIFKKCIC